MKVLITQPRGKENLVNAFEKAGAELIYPHMDFVKPDLIIPVVDEELPTMSYISSIIGSKVLISSNYTIDMCRSKAEFQRFCKRHNFPCVPTMQDNLIAKPTYGKGGRGFIRLDRSYVVQPFIDWPEYSADYFADWEGKCLSIIQRQRLDIVNGESKKAKIVWDIDIHKMLHRLGTELGIIGPAVIQYFSNGSDILISEVNPRYGGGSHLTFPIFDSPRWLLTHEAIISR